ncbi:hypothetical protein [Microlunatus sp. GCM10028923]|uniref:copper amine oxidase n=1 Tax=Microlunatus sp. GCM10028923 TaxID=3273400 RepID=UPI003611A12B
MKYVQGRGRILIISAMIIGLIVAGVVIAVTRAAGGPADKPIATTLDCAQNQPIATALSSGSSWAMCWRIDPYSGLTLENIHFTPVGRAPIMVLASLAIGQLEVPYDTGERTTEDITDHGFGGRNLQTLSGTECAGEILTTHVPNFGDGKVGGGEDRGVLCQAEVDTGIAYRAQSGGKVDVARGTALNLSTISKVGWYEYVNSYQFGADGSIRPALGATGDLSPEDYTDDPSQGRPIGPGDSHHAASHSHNAVWRLHWALGGRGGQRAEQYDADLTGDQGPKSPELTGELTPITEETTRKIENRRWWRIVNPAVLNEDRHPISYQIEIGDTDSYRFTDEARDHDDAPEPAYDIAFTEYAACELFATKNRSCPERSVMGYLRDQQALDDVVSWVAVGFHHVVRDEDQSPMDLHWQGFTLLPRDLTAQRPDLPEGRTKINGRPDESR